MKNTKKKILTLTITITLFFLVVLTTIVNANNIPPIGTVNNTKITNTASEVIGIIQLIGIAVAVAMLIIYGVRYFTVAPDKQADLKKAIWGYIIGAVCIFGAVVILQFVKDTLDGSTFFKNSGSSGSGNTTTNP